MIRATLFYNKNNDVYRFKVRYHGAPVVCAGVSALVITCVNYIQTNFQLDCTLQIEDMEFIDFEVSELKSGQTIKDASLIIDNMVFGLRLIEESYGDDIQIEEKTKN